MRALFTTWFWFCLALVSACEHKFEVAARDSTVDPDIGFEALLKTLQEDQAHWQKRVGMSFRQKTRQGFSSILGDEFLLGPTVAEDTPLPQDALLASEEFLGSLESFVEAYSPPPSLDNFGGLSAENLNRLDEFQRKRAPLKAFLQEVKNPSTRWLNSSLKMEVLPSVFLNRLDEHLALQYLKFGLRSTRALTHGAYFIRGKVTHHFEEMRNVEEGFCSLYGTHADESFALTPSLEIESIDRYVVLPEKSVAETENESRGVWETLRIYFQARKADEKTAMGQYGELWCYRYAAEPKEMTREDLTSILGENIQFPHWEREVLKSRGEFKDERPSSMEIPTDSFTSDQF